MFPKGKKKLKFKNYRNLRPTANAIVMIPSKRPTPKSVPAVSNWSSTLLTLFSTVVVAFAPELFATRFELSPSSAKKILTAIAATISRVTNTEGRLPKEI